MTKSRLPRAQYRRLVASFRTDTVKRLEALAETHGVSLSFLIARLVESGLDAAEKSEALPAPSRVGSRRSSKSESA